MRTARLEERAADPARRVSARPRATASATFLVYRRRARELRGLRRAPRSPSPRRCRRTASSKGDRVAVDHAQPAGMAGRLLRRRLRRRDRHPAECLVDRAGAGIRAGRFRREGRHRRSTSGWAARANTCDNCPRPEARLSSAAWREESPHPKVAKLEDVIGAAERLAATLPDLPLPDVRARARTTTPPSSTPPARPGSRRARSAPIATSTSNIVARRHSAARNFLRRGEPVPAPDPKAPQRSPCCWSRSSMPPAASR